MVWLAPMRLQLMQSCLGARARLRSAWTPVASPGPWQLHTSRGAQTCQDPRLGSCHLCQASQRVLRRSTAGPRCLEKQPGLPEQLHKLHKPHASMHKALHSRHQIRTSRQGWCQDNANPFSDMHDRQPAWEQSRELGSSTHHIHSPSGWSSSSSSSSCMTYMLNS